MKTNTHREYKAPKPPRELFTFGSYDSGDAHWDVENLSRMAMDIVTTAQALLRHASGEGEDLQPKELLSAGCLLEWAQQYLAWHGNDGEKAAEEKIMQWKATQRRGNARRKVAA